MKLEAQTQRLLQAEGLREQPGPRAKEVAFWLLGNKSTGQVGKAHPKERLTAQTNAGQRRYDCSKGAPVWGLS